MKIVQVDADGFLTLPRTHIMLYAVNGTMEYLPPFTAGLFVSGKEYIP